MVAAAGCGGRAGGPLALVRGWPAARAAAALRGPCRLARPGWPRGSGAREQAAPGAGRGGGGESCGGRAAADSLRVRQLSSLSKIRLEQLAKSVSPDVEPRVEQPVTWPREKPGQNFTPFVKRCSRLELSVVSVEQGRKERRSSA